MSQAYNIVYIIVVDSISIKLDDGKRFYMVQGVASGLNLTLARISAIESNLYALERVANYQNARVETPQEQNEDFSTILDAKIKEAPKEEKKEETPAIEHIGSQTDIEKPKASQTLEPVEKPVEVEDLEFLEKEELKKSPLNLKPKISLAPKTENIDDIIDIFADKYDVDSNFIKAIIKQESGFKPNATSKKGAMGLMQLMPQTAKSLGVIDAYNPRENIEGGVKYLKNLLNNYNGNKELALAAYNAGSGAVKKYGGVPPYKETQNYIKNIMASYDKFNEVQL